MILSCNSCEKKFVVPDQAITAAGRVVQCGSCGNKWKQFPVTNDLQKSNKIKKNITKKKSTITKIPKQIKKKPKKTREINLYSPEYLKKKHGISLENDEKKLSSSSVEKVSFGFYNSLLLFIILIIAFSRGLYFLQDFIHQYFPFTKFYLDYFFESIKNMFEIWKNLISIY